MLTKSGELVAESEDVDADDDKEDADQNADQLRKDYHQNPKGNRQRTHKLE